MLLLDSTPSRASHSFASNNVGHDPTLPLNVPAFIDVMFTQFDESTCRSRFQNKKNKDESGPSSIEIYIPGSGTRQENRRKEKQKHTQVEGL